MVAMVVGRSVVYVPSKSSSGSSSHRDATQTPLTPGTAVTGQALRQPYKPDPVGDFFSAVAALIFIGAVLAICIGPFVWMANDLNKMNEADRAQKKAAEERNKAYERERAESLARIAKLEQDRRERQEAEEGEKRLAAAFARADWERDAPRRAAQAAAEKAEEDKRWAAWVAAYPYK